MFIYELNNYLMQRGYNIDSFDKLTDDNIEINNIVYETNIKIFNNYHQQQ